MLPFLGSAVWTSAPFALATTMDAWFVYAAIAWFIGLLAWSKYNEPALSPPYPVTAAPRGLEGAGAAATVVPPPSAPLGHPAADRDRA